MPADNGFSSTAGPATDWRQSLARAIRDRRELLSRLGLNGQVPPLQDLAAAAFPVLVPESYLARIEPGNADDPLLRQVLPVAEEMLPVPGFRKDALNEADAHLAPGLLKKYASRALLIASGACAVHCRYCFRRHYPYGAEPRQLDDWEPAFQAIRDDASLTEIILSGGDPLMLSDSRLAVLSQRLAEIEHLTRLRIHTRLPIVLPDRVTGALIDVLRSTRLLPIVVVHANHPNEIAVDCSEALSRLVSAGIPVLNQSVLLAGVNDSADVLAELSQRLVDLGVFPYYLHQLDRVAGAAHFEVSEERGGILIDELRSRLPGYAVPKYVRETPGELSKSPLA